MNLNIMTVKAKVTTAMELTTPISAGYGDGRKGVGGGHATALFPSPPAGYQRILCHADFYYYVLRVWESR